MGKIAGWTKTSAQSWRHDNGWGLRITSGIQGGNYSLIIWDSRTYQRIGSFSLKGDAMKAAIDFMEDYSRRFRGTIRIM